MSKEKHLLLKIYFDLIEMCVVKVIVSVKMV